MNQSNLFQEYCIDTCAILDFWDTQIRTRPYHVKVKTFRIIWDHISSKVGSGSIVVPKIVADEIKTIPNNDELKEWLDKNLTPEEKAKNGIKLNRSAFDALEAFGYELGKQGALDINMTRVAGDQNTVFYIEIDGVKYSATDAVVKGYIKALDEKGIKQDHPEAIASGKYHYGHMPFRGTSTGVGAIASLDALKERFEDSLEGKEVFFRGSGSATQGMITELNLLGAKVTAIAADSAIIVKESGFTEQDQESIFDFMNIKKAGGIQDWARTQKDVRVHFEAELGPDKDPWFVQLENAVFDYWDNTSPAVIIEAATQGTINENAVAHLPEFCYLIEVANLATTPKAAEMLKSRKGIKRTCAAQSSGGGIFGSDYEIATNLLGIEFDDNDLRGSLFRMMKDVINNVYDLIEIAKSEYGLDMTPEEAFYCYSIARSQKIRSELLSELQQAA